jgi:hypothetical protein
MPIGILTTAIVKRVPRYEGKSAAVWFDELRFHQDQAVQALRHLDRVAIPVLQDRLKSSSVTERCRAALVLGKFGQSALDTVPDLCKLLDDSDYGVQQAGMVALLRIGITNLDVCFKLENSLSNTVTAPVAATLLNDIVQRRKKEKLPNVYNDEMKFCMVFVHSTSQSVRINGAIKLAVLAKTDERAKAELESLVLDDDPAMSVYAGKLLANNSDFQEYKLVSY